MFNLMGRFSYIQMLRVGEVEFVDSGRLRVNNSYMVSNPDGLVFCVYQGKVVMIDTVISHGFFLKLFRTALDKVDLPGDDFFPLGQKWSLQ